MKFFARIEELNRKCVFIAAKPLDPLSVLRPHLDKARLISFARTRFEDDLAQFIGFEIADGRKVRGEAAPEAVDHMAGDATALARKDLLADRRISGNLFRFPAHRTQVADDLPDLVVRKSHRGHCGSSNTVLDDIEKRGVLIAMFEDALVYSRAAPAIAFRAVTTGAHLVVDALAGSDSFWFVGERIFLTGIVVLREQYCRACAKDGKTQNQGTEPHLMTS